MARHFGCATSPDISDDEYHDFYKNTCHDFEAPLAWVHNRVEGTNEYSSLLFVPARARSICGTASRSMV